MTITSKEKHIMVAIQSGVRTRSRATLQRVDRVINGKECLEARSRKMKLQLSADRVFLVVFTLERPLFQFNADRCRIIMGRRFKLIAKNIVTSCEAKDEGLSALFQASQFFSVSFVVMTTAPADVLCDSFVDVDARSDNDDANRHIDKFLEITQHMKQNGVSDNALRLSLFPYSLMHYAIAWYDRLPRNSIHSFDDMMRKFLLKYFPPSMRYKLSIDRCPNHNMLLVTQIDTFYNGLRLSHRDTINDVVGGTFVQKTPEECYTLIENMTAQYNHWDTSATRDETSRNISSTTITESPEIVSQLEMMNKNFLDMMREMQSVKSMSPKCETCGGPHSFTECPAADGYT
ncbi:hypothetical protein Tco_0435882 [Tanacetum coccineum]